MKVRLAKKAGFCMGVRRAMELALDATHRHPDPIYTHGPLIHNPQVLRMLENKGITVLQGEATNRTGTVIVRAHGIPPQEFERLNRSGFRVIDATCPRVIKVQAVIKKYYNQGFTPIIVGDQDHPEVIGLLGFAPGTGIVVSSLDQVPGLPDLDRVIVVAQTTQDETLFQEIVAALRRRYPEILVFNTICNATHERQAEVKQLARESDGLVVVGGFNSGNTRRLVGIARAAGTPCVQVETEAELDQQQLSRFRTVGVTAGASTPNWMIRKVVQELETIKGRDESWLRNVWFRCIRLLLKSNLLVALGAAGLSLVAARLRPAAPWNGIYFGITFLHIYAMHILNHMLDTEAAEYNDPDRSRLYQRHRTLFLSTGIAAAALSLLLTLSRGLLPFLLLATMTLSGILYSIRIVPAVWQQLFGLKKIKDIPASKSLSVALGWGGVTTLIPALAEKSWPDPAVPVVFFIICSLVYIRSGLFDILDIQGDLIVGKETLPILVGEKRTIRLLKGLGLGIMAALLLSFWMGITSPFALWLLVSAGYLMLFLVLFEKKWLLTGIYFEALVESGFILAGFLALLVP
ncbi:MAG: 4-hydroxy-3-methylbut-2-enyl diphosphate reductase [Deltaproteobacteria bacterium]|nr:4-hydroxy-3-methylbut-2-enyl diphosphate reductase [Deltaproteobacteria bacterium]